MLLLEVINDLAASLVVDCLESFWVVLRILANTIKSMIRLLCVLAATYS